MAPRLKRGSISKANQGHSRIQRGDDAGSNHETAAGFLQSCAYSPACNLGNAEPTQPPPRKSPPDAIPRGNILEEAEKPRLYYPKEKGVTDRGPDSAPLLRRGSSSEVTGQPFQAVRKVSSTPRLRDYEIIFGRNRTAAQQNSSRASSVGSAETRQEDYCRTIPKLEGIILGSPDLSLTKKGTCGTRGSGKVIVPERKASSVQGSIEIGDAEKSSNTVTPKRLPSESNTEISLPGQNLHLSSLQLPPRPPTAVEFRQRSLSQGANSQTSFFSCGRSITRARGVKNRRRSSAKCNISRTQRVVPFFVPHSFNSHHDHYMAPNASPGQDSNVTEPEPAIDSPNMVPQILSGEAPQNEILSQLKALTQSVADIKIQQMRINKQLEDTNTHLKKFSEELQLEKDARVRSLAVHEETINGHITQVVGELGEAVESVVVTVAKISDNTANIGSRNSKVSEGHDLKWSDAMEQEASDASVRTQTSTHTILSDKCYTGPSTTHNRGKSMGCDVGKENVGNPIGRGRSQTNPSTASRDQGQQRPSGWRGPPSSQKRGFWKRHRGGMGRRGSASGSGGGKYPTPNSDGQQQPAPMGLQAQEVTPPSSYSHPHMHGGYEDQPRIHPAARTPDPPATRGQASGQQHRFPPRQSSMRHNHSLMRGGIGPSSQNCMPHRDFSPNYGSPLPQWGQGRSQPTFHHFQATQHPSNNPPGGQWPAANPEFNNTYKPWAGVSNWYHQVNSQGNNNIRSPPS
ncbi:hypothetical protein ACJ73_00762 [Blastomyces percursus]|uniref:Uncharacterized protein n=1 Tax=Blastomyces percursus TaxID=1658174 RepID=A0A1J9QIB8_9EURO|nr:hypothetical protein ACJ73_00762 [Blastomyces percursus]